MASHFESPRLSAIHYQIYGAIVYSKILVFLLDCPFSLQLNLFPGILYKTHFFSNFSVSALRLVKSPLRPLRLQSERFSPERANSVIRPSQPTQRGSSQIIRNRNPFTICYFLWVSHGLGLSEVDSGNVRFLQNQSRESLARQMITTG